METRQKPFGEVIEELDREIRSWQITVENRDAEILHLKAELEAVGAGGAQPLRASPVSPVGAESAEGMVPVAAYDRLQDLCDAQAARLLTLEDASTAITATLETVAVGNEDVQDLVSKALRKDWQLGQTYWQQADSEFLSQQAKSDATQAKFQELVDETRATLSTQPAAVAVGEREAFERYQCNIVWRDLQELSQHANGYYDCDDVQAEWDAWQARAALATTQEVPADPMDWALPCDITVGHGTMRKGVKLRTLVLRMKALYNMATGEDTDEVANRTPEDRSRMLSAFQAQIGSTPAKAEMQAEPVADSFLEWFAKNYPSDTIIIDPDWHAQSIYRAAMAHARLTSPQATQQDAIDAGRYRWLRENWFYMGASYADAKIEFSVSKMRWSTIHVEALDAKIDAAIQAAEINQENN